MMKFAALFWNVPEKSEVERFFKIRIAEDDTGYLQDIHNPVVSKFSKHVDIKYQFMVDHVLKGIIDVCFLPTDSMMADMMTQNLKRIKFVEMINMMRIGWMSFSCFCCGGALKYCLKYC